MRRALIINCNGFVPCSQDCTSLIDLLNRSQAFAQIEETSIAAAHSEVDCIPDLILPRFSFENYSRREIEVCANVWPSARVFALLCSQNLNCKRIPVGFFDVDDFLCCPYEEAEFLLRMKRLLKRREIESIQTMSGPDTEVLIGRSEAFLDTVRQVKLLAQSKAPVIISGETGSGKELLESVIQRAIVLREGEVLTAADLELNNNGNEVQASDLFRLGKLRAIVQFERNFIARLLAAHGGNISRAAKAAGKDRRSFQRLVSKYSLDRKSFETQML